MTTVEVVAITVEEIAVAITLAIVAAAIAVEEVEVIMGAAIAVEEVAEEAIAVTDGKCFKMVNGQLILLIPMVSIAIMALSHEHFNKSILISRPFYGHCFSKLYPFSSSP
jgi:hypothetical protein